MRNLVLSLIGLMVAAPLAGAAPVTFIYNSTTDASAVGGPVSDPVSLVFTFDSNLPNQEYYPQLPDGQYYGWNGTLTVGKQSVTINDGGINLNNSNGAGPEGYQLVWSTGADTGNPNQTSSGTLFGLPLFSFDIVIVDNSGTMFSSNALPTNTNFAPHTNYFIQDDYFLENDQIGFGLDESNPPGRPYTLTLATQYWDGRGAAHDGIITGGSGTWNATSTNWTTIAGATNGKWQSYAAIFGGTAGTVTLGGPVSATGLTFQVDGYVIAGASALTLTGLGPTLTMNGSATIAAPIAGQNGLIESGPGKLTLTSAASSYTGGTTVAGTLQIGTTAAAGSLGSGAVSLDDGATLSVVMIRSYRLPNDVSNGGGGLGTLEINSAGINTLSGALTDGAGQLALTQDGAGTTILANASNTYTGDTTVSRGLLQVGTSMAAGSIGAGSNIGISGTGALKLINVAGSNFTTNITDNATGSGSVTLAPSGNLTVSGAISGSGSVLVSGTPSALPVPGASQSVTLNGYNTYTGPTTVTSGTLQIGDGFTGNLNPSSVVTVSGAATLVLNPGGQTDFANKIVNNGHVTAAGSGFYHITGAISGTGNFLKTGPGTAVLTHTNTYTGPTTINGGALGVTNTTGSATGTGPVTVNNGGTLSGSGSVSGAVTLNGGGQIFPTVAASQIGVSLHIGSMTWNGGASTLAFALGPNSSDQINLTGALRKGGSGAYNIQILDEGFTAGPIDPQTYTLMTFASTTFAPTNFTLQLPQDVTGTLVETKTSLLLENVSKSTISGGGTTVNGGTLTLTGATIYNGTGGLIINGTISNGGFLGGTILNGLLVNGTNYTGYNYNGGLLTLTNGTGGILTGAGTVTNTSVTLTLNGGLTYTGGTIAGGTTTGGTLTIGGTNWGTGGLIIDNNTYTGGTLTGGGATLTFNGGLNYTGGTVVVNGNLVQNGTATTNLTTGTNFFIANSGELTTGAPVPEPASGLLLLGAGSALLARRRRKS